MTCRERKPSNNLLTWYVFEQFPYEVQCTLSTKPVADLRGAQGTRPPPLGSKFFRFHAVFGKFWQNRMFAPPRGVGAPSSGKSWIRHWKRFHWTSGFLSLFTIPWRIFTVQEPVCKGWWPCSARHSMTALFGSDAGVLVTLPAQLTSPSSRITKVNM